MYIHGTFTSQRGEAVAVHIVTKGDRSQELEVGTEASDTYFTDDPVEITSEVGDTFDVLLRQSAKVRLLCGGFISDLFSATCRDAVVNVYKGGKCVFAGFVEPMTFSQPYNDRWDELELNCVDALSALQYSKHMSVGTLGVPYALAREEASERTFLDIVGGALAGVAADLDIVGGEGARLWYDGSKAIDGEAGNSHAIFSQLKISDLLFLGGDEADVWGQDAVVESILKFLDLHVAQDGLDFRIFSWATAKGSAQIEWADLLTGERETQSRQTVEISLSNVASDDTTISIGDVYNRLELTATLDDVDDLVESPLDDDLVYSPYANKQKYMTAMASGGEGESAYNAFRAMTHDEATSYDGANVKDWYVQLWRNKRWTFPMRGNEGVDLVDYFAASGHDQHALPMWLGANMGAALLSLGSVERKTDNTDNSPTVSVSMEKSLVVGVNGNGDHTTSGCKPSEADLKAAIPMAVYTGNSGGGVLSPSDDDTTNYIVFSGKVTLTPLMRQTADYTDLHNKEWTLADGGGGVQVWHHTVASRNGTGENGQYYTRKFWKAGQPSDEPTWNEGHDAGFYPFSDDWTSPQWYEYQGGYISDGSGEDKISKVAVVCCMLIVGDKCVVEKTPGNDQGDTDSAGNPIPYTDDAGSQCDNYVWKAYKERSECASDDEYYSQSFTLGFNPKVGDKLIGTEFNLQTNTDLKRNLGVEGTAIRIRKSDDLSGQVRFKILGPVNSEWGTVSKTVHRTAIFFKRTETTIDFIPLLSDVSSIILKQFEVKVCSDNGGVSDGNTGNDILYVSDTAEAFTNKKDDLEMKVNSALTTDERRSLGVEASASLSTPHDTVNGGGVLKIFDRTQNAEAKAEQIYVDAYYREWHKPRVVMEQKLNDDGEATSRFNHYRHAALNKEFFVQGVGRNLMQGYAQLTLKEIEDEE